MKKILAVFLSVLLLQGAVVGLGYAVEDIAVVVNGAPLVSDVAPIVVEGRTLAPLRAIAEAMGVSITWVEEQQMVSFSDGVTTFELKIGDSTVTKRSGENTTFDTIDVPPMIHDGRTLVPLRFLAESLKIDVSYDGAANTVYVGGRGADKVPQNFTNGYEAAQFSKFNSPASENGLGGTKIYLECVIDKVFALDTNTIAGKAIYAHLTDGNNNKWLGLLHMTALVNETEFDSFIGKSVVYCGTYEGYSDTEKMPAVNLDQFCVRETGEIKSGLGKLASIGGNTSPEAGKDQQNPPAKVDLSTSSAIESYLTEKYPSVDTAMGTWKFKYNVIENDWEEIPQDYSICVTYDLGQMNDLNYSNKYTTEQKDQTKKQLKAFMKTIADDLLSRIKDKKIKCSYYYSYYKYEYINEGLTVLEYCTWINYEPGNNYHGTKASTFRWYQDYDEEKW